MEINFTNFFARRKQTNKIFPTFPHLNAASTNNFGLQDQIDCQLSILADHLNEWVICKDKNPTKYRNHLTQREEGLQVVYMTVYKPGLISGYFSLILLYQYKKCRVLCSLRAQQPQTPISLEPEGFYITYVSESKSLK